MLFKNWKLLFENMYQTPTKYLIFFIAFLSTFLTQNVFHEVYGVFRYRLFGWKLKTENIVTK